MSKMVRWIFTAVGFLVLVGILISLTGVMQMMGGSNPKVSENSLLHLELEGMILDGKDFLEKLKNYRDDDKIKGIVVQVNSPGGVVGPSQEIFSELKRVRDELKKPVVVSCSGLAASGAYYIAVAATKIITNPGTLMGSIGVIMEFANLEKLYDWAKVHRYTITSGQFKDSGSEYRAMRPEEHKLFQSLISEVYEQFKSTVRDNRKIDPQVLDENTDGRVFTGQTAVKLGFADEVGTFEDAVRIAGKLAGLSGKPKLFKPPKKRESLLDYFSDEAKSSVSHVLGVTPLALSGKPLYLVPGSWSF